MHKDYLRKSVVADYITGLLEEKRSMGFSYIFEEYLLNEFDNYCIIHELDNPCFDRDFLDEWLKTLPDESPSYHGQRISFVRQLALYMNGLGINAYIPVESVSNGYPAPHFLSAEEINDFFTSLDNDTPKVTATYAWRAWNEYRVIFRLLYSCGMRNSEACCLRTEHVALDRGILEIYHSKGRKDRIVYLADDMQELLIQYQKYLFDTLGFMPDWFFPSPDPSKHIHKATLDSRFNRVWSRTPHAARANKKPTVHSLRHSFVVDRMNSWLESGLSFDEMLPYLSKYLGHSGVEESLYYYHLNEEANIIIRRKDRTVGRVLPEVSKYGT